MLESKFCPKCKKIKSVSEFYKAHDKKDGLKANCKSCHTEYIRANPDIKHAAQAKYRERNREGLREKNKKYSVEKREKANDKLRRWRANNRDRCVLHDETRRAKIKGNGGKITLEEWNKALDFYGNKCLKCGKSNVKLTIDHVVPIFLGGRNVIENTQPLCKSCNSSKFIKTTDYRNGLIFTGV